ncbi:hypothetical protein [Ancylomarina longa]|uniref:Uncharacterized protein n=1 Tax=Ancylomarina longa TaxID=2487017 RepID=A0A434AVM0_9BACT|nr:hypothetical protein [Ancylomarina longa]RUT78537.1 hypothetical protein DLK05_08185 [Ancylomarina longa]
MHSKLSYKEKCACERSDFCTFVYQSEGFNDVNKKYLVQAIVGDRISGLLYVSGTLTGWSFVAGIIDSVLFPGVFIYALLHGVVDYKVLMPPVLFLSLNLIAKIGYISYNLLSKVKFYDILISSLPYAGSAYLLKKFIVNDKVLSKAIYSYLKIKKKKIQYEILRFFHLISESN